MEQKDTIESRPSKSGLLYTPLNKTRPHIRLLRFSTPHVGDHQISLTLFKASLDSDPSFVALSYEWGIPSNVENILINGMSFPVTRNLALALKQMSSQFSDQTLWVDAICINQASVEERNHQVQLMRRIYQQAAIVFSWLGESDEESRQAVKLLRHLADTWIKRVGPEFDETSKEMDLKGVDGLDDLWQELRVGIHPLNALFMKSYWKRVWIMQETMLAKHMVCICGSDAFTADQITSASTIVLLAVRTPGLFTVETRFFLSCSSMVGVYRRISKEPSSMNTAVLFSFARSFRATDPRDYIYGLIGLIDLDIRPDYSLSVRAVYCSFARSWITQTSRLDVLKFAGTALTIEEDRTDGLPTWVPDWHALSKCYQEPCSSKFNASAEMQAEARISTDLSRLWLNGMRCDEITSIVPHMGATGNNLRDLSEYYWSVVLNPNDANAYSQGTTRVEAAFWLLFQDEHKELKSNLVKLRRYVFMYCSIMSQVNGIERLVAQLPHHESDSKIEEFCKDNGGNTIHLKAILGLCMQFAKSVFDNLDVVLTLLSEMTNEGFDINTDVDGMELFASSNLRATYTVAFHTSKGRIGLLRHCLANNISDGEAAAETRPSNVILTGDVICVLAGHDYPVVLRRKSYYFVLVGVCSVIGLMDGEVVELVRAGDAECKLLEIR